MLRDEKHIYAKVVEKIRLTVLHPSALVCQYAHCPACNFPKSLDSPLTSYTGAGCFLKQGYSTFACSLYN